MFVWQEVQPLFSSTYQHYVMYTLPFQTKLAARPTRYCCVYLYQCRNLPDIFLSGTFLLELEIIVLKYLGDTSQFFSRLIIRNLSALSPDITDV